MVNVNSCRKKFEKIHQGFPSLSSFGYFFFSGKGYSFWNERQEKAFYFDPNQNFKKEGHHKPASVCLLHIVVWVSEHRASILLFT